VLAYEYTAVGVTERRATKQVADLARRRRATVADRCQTSSLVGCDETTLRQSQDRRTTTVDCWY